MAHILRSKLLNFVGEILKTQTKRLKHLNSRAKVKKDQEETRQQNASRCQTFFS